MRFKIGNILKRLGDGRKYEVIYCDEVRQEYVLLTNISIKHIGTTVINEKYFFDHFYAPLETKLDKVLEDDT